jgi:hypothetical protein
MYYPQCDHTVYYTFGYSILVTHSCN